MSLELSERTIGIWSVDLMNGSDWLGSVWREGNQYVMEYRFRYHVDDKTFDSKDKKNWYRAKIAANTTTEDELISAIRTIVKVMWQVSGGKRYEILMGSGGAPEMMAELKKWPSISMLTLTPEQAEERGP